MPISQTQNRFQSIKEIYGESLRALEAIPRKDFLAYFEELHKCVILQGGCFEGYKIDLDGKIMIFHFIR